MCLQRFSCLTKLEKFLCLKYFGRTLSARPCGLRTTKDFPSYRVVQIRDSAINTVWWASTNFAEGSMLSIEIFCMGGDTQYNYNDTSDTNFSVSTCIPITKSSVKHVKLDSLLVFCCMMRMHWEGPHLACTKLWRASTARASPILHHYIQLLMGQPEDISGALSMVTLPLCLESSDYSYLKINSSFFSISLALDLLSFQLKSSPKSQINIR